jgi:hypothetical protein
VDRVASRDLLILLGDMNAKTGSNFSLWGRTLGKHGIGEENENGSMLLHFCKENKMVITNSHFIHKKCRKVTWRSADGRTENLIDYVIIKMKDLRCVLNTRAYKAAELDGTDHSLVVSELKLKIPRAKRVGGPRLAVEGLINDESTRGKFEMEVRNRFETLVDEVGDPKEEFDRMKDNLNEAASKCLEKRARVKGGVGVNRETRVLMEEVRELKVKLGNARTRLAIEKAKVDVSNKRRELKAALIREREEHWNGVARSMEEALDKNDTRKFFEKVGKICHTENRKLIGFEPVRSEDGAKRLTGKAEILDRWKEHCQKLLNKESGCNDVTQIRTERLVEEDEEMSREVRLYEVELAIKQLKNWKAPGVDKIHAEYLKYGGEKAAQWMHRVIEAVWSSGEIPEDWRKMIIILLHKKGSREECNNARGISLLSVPGKVFTRVILNRIFRKINQIMRENQCGFRPGRGCQDQVFTMRQIMEKSSEFAQQLYACFVDFKQAYDSVWRDGLWAVLRRYGIPEKVVKLIEKLYEGTKACVRIEGETSEWFEVKTGVRQGCILSPCLFNIALDHILREVDGVNQGSVGLRMEEEVVWDLEYADDTALLAVSLSGLIELLNAFGRESEKLGLNISVPKTKWMMIGEQRETNVKVEYKGQEVERVSSFTYLGSELEANGGCLKDVTRRIALAGVVFSKLTKGLWQRNDIRLKTKLRVYNAMVVPVALYGSESWTMSAVVKRRLDVFDGRCLRRILGIRWPRTVSNEELRKRTGQPEMSELGVSRMLRWAGHVWRMGSERLVRRAERWIPTGKRRVGKPRKRWKDMATEEARARGARGRNLEEVAQDRVKWRQLHCGWGRKVGYDESVDN